MRRIGDRRVTPIGLGAMPLSNPQMLQRRDQAIATVHAALAAGVRLIDTADAYAPSAAEFGHNERLVGEALRSWRAGAAEDGGDVLVATKGGLTRGPGEVWGRDARPESLLRAAEASAGRLGGEAIDLYYLHRPDPAVSYGQQVEGLAAVRREGIARMVGLSNVTPVQLDRALELIGGPDDGGVAAVQNEFSPAYRADSEVLRRCAERGIALVPWSPFGGVGRGEVSDRYSAFHRVGARHGVSAHRIVLAWLLSLGPNVIPIPGATRPETIRDSAAAGELVLGEADLAELNATTPTNRSVFPDDTPPPPM